MRLRPARLALALAVPALCLAAAVSSEARPAQEPGLSDFMVGLKNNLKTVATNLPDPAQDETTLAALGEMQALSLVAKRLEPTNVGEVPEERRGDHVKAFRADMGRLAIELIEIEIDLLEGRREKAIGRIRGGLFAMREEAHERYQPEQ